MFTTEAWFWIWVILAAFFYVAEIFTAAFFMMPFGVGATVAALLAYFGLGLGWQWGAFIVVSGVSVFLLRRYSDRYTHDPPEKAGVDRLIGMTGIVIEELIPHSSVGMVRIRREEWRADAPGHDLVPVRTKVLVEGVDGTHLIVRPLLGVEAEESEIEDAERILDENG